MGHILTVLFEPTPDIVDYRTITGVFDMLQVKRICDFNHVFNRLELRLGINPEDEIVTVSVFICVLQSDPRFPRSSDSVDET